MTKYILTKDGIKLQDRIHILNDDIFYYRQDGRWFITDEKTGRMIMNVKCKSRDLIEIWESSKHKQAYNEIIKTQKYAKMVEKFKKEVENGNI